MYIYICIILSSKPQTLSSKLFDPKMTSSRKTQVPFADTTAHFRGSILEAGTKYRIQKLCRLPWLARLRACSAYANFHGSETGHMFHKRSAHWGAPSSEYWSSRNLRFANTIANFRGLQSQPVVVISIYLSIYLSMYIYLHTEFSANTHLYTSVVIHTAYTG